MATYKVTYFNGRGRAETVRMVLAQAGIAFDDCRLPGLESDEWAKLKPKTPLGKLPIFEADGHMLAESTAIARFLAKRFGLAGADEFEEAKCDMLVCAVEDAYAKFSPWFHEKDVQKKKGILEQINKDHTLPFIQKLEVLLAENHSGFFVGKSVTWADLHLYDFCARLPTTFELSEEQMKEFAQVAAFTKTVEELPKIKAWFDKRPNTLW